MKKHVFRFSEPSEYIQCDGKISILDKQEICTKCGIVRVKNPFAVGDYMYRNGKMVAWDTPCK